MDEHSTGIRGQGPNAPLVVVATTFPKADCLDTVRAALTKAVLRVRVEDDGCLQYDLTEGGDRFIMIEKWTDEGAYARHQLGGAVAELDLQLRQAVRSPLDVQVLRAVEP